MSETIISLDKPLVLFSSSNCIACVYYFSKQKHKFNYLIVLNNKSLAETAMMLSNYKLNKESVHFTTKKYYNTNLTITPSPCLVFKNNKGTFFLDYSTVSQFTNEFSLPYKKLIKKIN
ncbi:MAG: hypothetical protein LCH32_10710 [Bacteroidetes bacterium]|nr:hypothetical protein [Bacteroidota bacterium]